MSRAVYILFHALLWHVEVRSDEQYFYKGVASGMLTEMDVISFLNVHSELECIVECLARTGCVSFNYKSKTSGQENCQLSDKTRDEIAEVLKDGEWVFYQGLETVKSRPVITNANCADLYDSGVTEDGVYSIDPDGIGPFQVRCEMSAGAGWTVIQRRLDGSVDFYLGWSQYKSGFGDLNGEFWLGLDKIHRLTKSGLNVLRVDLMDFQNAQAYAQYMTFNISDESTRYALTVGDFSGNAGDSLAYHNGHKFSTKDNDITGSCPEQRKGAWWYGFCAWSNLNGQYLGENQDEWHGVQWYYWKDTNECMKQTQMKLRP